MSQRPIIVTITADTTQFPEAMARQAIAEQASSSPEWPPDGLAAPNLYSGTPKPNEAVRTAHSAGSHQGREEEA